MWRKYEIQYGNKLRPVHLLESAEKEEQHFSRYTGISWIKWKYQVVDIKLQDNLFSVCGKTMKLNNMEILCYSLSSNAQRITNRIETGDRKPKDTVSDSTTTSQQDQSNKRKHDHWQVIVKMNTHFFVIHIVWHWRQRFSILYKL